MTRRIATTLNNILTIIAKGAVGDEKATLLKVRERINALLEEAEAADASTAALIEAIAAAESKNGELVAENQKLISQYEEIIHGYAKTTPATDHMADVYKVLIGIHKFSEQGAGVNVDNIVLTTGLSRIKTDYCLSELVSRHGWVYPDLVEFDHSSPYYCVTPKGLKHLIESKLIK